MSCCRVEVRDNLCLLNGAQSVKTKLMEGGGDDDRHHDDVIWYRGCKKEVGTSPISSNLVIRDNGQVYVLGTQIAYDFQ